MPRPGMASHRSFEAIGLLTNIFKVRSQEVLTFIRMTPLTSSYSPDPLLLLPLQELHFHQMHSG